MSTMKDLEGRIEAFDAMLQALRTELSNLPGQTPEVDGAKFFSTKVATVTNSYLNGDEIEYQPIGTNVWMPAEPPRWDWKNCRYRVKPEGDPNLMMVDRFYGRFDWADEEVTNDNWDMHFDPEALVFYKHITHGDYTCFAINMAQDIDWDIVLTYVHIGVE